MLRSKGINNEKVLFSVEKIPPHYFLYLLGNKKGYQDINFEELDRVLNLRRFNLIGINNRDLTTFNVDLSITEQLAKKHEKDLQKNEFLLVSESGLFSRHDLERVLSAGANAVLIGESLMRQTDITKGLKQLIGW